MILWIWRALQRSKSGQQFRCCNIQSSAWLKLEFGSLSQIRNTCVRAWQNTNCMLVFGFFSPLDICSPLNFIILVCLPARKTGFLCCCDICCPVVPFNTSHLRVVFFFKLLWYFNTPPVHCNYHFWRNLSDRASRRRAKMIKWMVATFLIFPLYFFIREIYTDILLNFIRIFFQICFIQNEGIHISLYSLASMTGEYFVNQM